MCLLSTRNIVKELQIDKGIIPSMDATISALCCVPIGSGLRSALGHDWMAVFVGTSEGDIMIFTDHGVPVYR